jgi:hypothetical protein
MLLLSAVIMGWGEGGEVHDMVTVTSKKNN